MRLGHQQRAGGDAEAAGDHAGPARTPRRWPSALPVRFHTVIAVDPSTDSGATVTKLILPRHFGLRHRRRIRHLDARGLVQRETVRIEPLRERRVARELVDPHVVVRRARRDRRCRAGRSRRAGSPPRTTFRSCDPRSTGSTDRESRSCAETPRGRDTVAARPPAHVRRARCAGVSDAQIAGTSSVSTLSKCVRIRCTSVASAVLASAFVAMPPGTTTSAATAVHRVQRDRITRYLV